MASLAVFELPGTACRPQSCELGGHTSFQLPCFVLPFHKVARTVLSLRGSVFLIKSGADDLFLRSILAPCLCCPFSFTPNVTSHPLSPQSVFLFRRKRWASSPPTSARISTFRMARSHHRREVRSHRLFQTVRLSHIHFGQLLCLSYMQQRTNGRYTVSRHSKNCIRASDFHFKQVSRFVMSSAWSELRSCARLVRPLDSFHPERFLFSL